MFFVIAFIYFYLQTSDVCQFPVTADIWTNKKKSHDIIPITVVYSQH